MKRERRRERLEPSPPPAISDVNEQREVLEEFERLHRDYANGEMSLDDFEARRQELAARLQVD